MSAINKVIIGGNLVRDPEVKYTPKGTAICDAIIENGSVSERLANEWNKAKGGA